MPGRIDFAKLPLWVNKHFYPLWWNRKRYIIKKGGAGSGKSVDTYRCAVYRMLKEHGHNYLVTRKCATTLSTSCIPEVKNAITEWNLWDVFDWKETSRTLTCLRTRNQMKFAGLDKVEKIKSFKFERGNLTDIIIEEASETTEKDFTQLDLRLRGLGSKVPYQITILFNPISDTHWLKKLFFDNPADLAPHITIHESTYLDNRFIDQAYIQRMNSLRLQDRLYYEIYALGKWGAIGNLVFRNIKFQKCPYTYQDFDFVRAGMDFGYNHKNAIELIGFKDGSPYSFGELYLKNFTNTAFIEENKKQQILDYTQQCTADSSRPEFITEWCNNGYWVENAVKGKGSVESTISYLNRSTWYIDPEKCPGLASEVQTYKWREDGNGNVLDEPLKFNDDAVDAARYAIEGLSRNELSMLDVM